MDYLKVSGSRWEDPLYDFFGTGSAIAKKIISNASNKGLNSYYFNHPYDDNKPEWDDSVPFGKEYVLQKFKYQISAILNSYPNFEKAQNAFDAAKVGGKVSLQTIEEGTENNTNAVTDRNETSGTGKNKTTFSPLNSAYEKTSDATEATSEATTNRTANTTDTKNTNKTTTREEFRGDGTEFDAIMKDFKGVSPIEKFLQDFEMILISPEEYYEIMNEMEV